MDGRNMQKKKRFSCYPDISDKGGNMQNKLSGQGIITNCNKLIRC